VNATRDRERRRGNDPKKPVRQSPVLIGLAKTFAVCEHGLGGKDEQAAFRRRELGASGEDRAAATVRRDSLGGPELRGGLQRSSLVRAGEEGERVVRGRARSAVGRRWHPRLRGPSGHRRRDQLNSSAGTAALAAMGLIDAQGKAIIDPVVGKKTVPQGASVISTRRRTLSSRVLGR
jgi:hypothetical protein